MPRLLADTTAPGFEPDAVGRSWWRRWLAQGGGYLGPSAAFLAIPLASSAGHVPAEGFAILVAVCLAIALFYLGTPLVMGTSLGARWAWLLGLMLSLLNIVWAGGQPDAAAYYAVYACVVAALLLPWPQASLVIPFIGIAGLLLAGLGRNPYAGLMAIVGGLIGYSIGQGLQTARTRAKLAAAEQRTAVLAVAAERERIGRDLHDILGHSLTTIAVKADLARRLVERDPARAASEIDDLASVARQALADVRATASGMREVRLAAEVAAARSVLDAAGIECRTPSALPVLDEARSELFGYVVREAVTNVVRHAGASVCRITVDDAAITITDDGRGFDTRSGRTGLRGLAERLDAAGGRLDVTSSDAGTTVHAALEPREEP